MPSHTPQPPRDARGHGNAHTSQPTDDLDEFEDDEELDDLEDDEAPRGSRGPLMLFAIGALLALTIAGAQFFHLPIPGLEYLPGGRHSAAASDARSGPRSDEVVHDLTKFREQFGDPKQATYGRIRIPSINVDAPLGRSAVGKDGQLADPYGPSDVLWYDFGSRKDLGGSPGSGGNAVLAGHVDRAGFVEYAGVQYSGPGVLFNLDRITPGDVIEVMVGGKTLRYAVIWAKQVPSNANWNELFSSKVLGDSLTLVTCGGDFNYDKHEYEHRLVVRAVRG